MTQYLGIALEDWFKYHPPTTEARKAKHEAVNSLSYSLAESIGDLHLNYCDGEVDQKVGQILELFNLPEKESTVQVSNWILSLANQLKAELVLSNKLMLIQQIRMFANQAVTFESLD